jgi:AcrR family transcriptional regulator
MQYPKEKVRARILESALDEFEAFGFSGASMRRIAQAAGVSTGNLYTYFSSKVAIFDEIVKAGYTSIAGLMSEAAQLQAYGRGDVRQLARQITAGIMKVHAECGRQLLVIADKSAGSQHERFLQTLSDMVFEQIRQELSPRVKEADGILIRVLASGFVNGMFMILRTVKDPERLAQLINGLLVLYFEGIEQRLSLA